MLREEDFRDFALIDLISCGGIRSDNPLCVNTHPHLYKRSLLEKYQLRFVDTCYVKNINNLLQSTRSFQLYCFAFYIGAGKLLMSDILNSLITNTSIREFICRIRLLKSDAMFSSIFRFYVVSQVEKNI